MRRLCVLVVALVLLALPLLTPSRASSAFAPFDSFLGDNTTIECPPGKRVNATQLGLKCAHGHLFCFPPSNTSSAYSLGCACDDGWAGVQCDRCNTSSACGVDTPCDHHAIPVRKKFFQCDLTGDFWKTALGDGVASFEEDFDHKSAVLNVWSKPSGPPMFFSCNVTDCSFAVDQGRDGTRFDYYCLKTSCWCPRDPVSGHCYSEPIENATRYLKTTALFSCDTDENPNCFLQQHELGIQIDMKCYVGECAKPPKWQPNSFSRFFSHFFCSRDLSRFSSSGQSSSSSRSSLSSYSSPSLPRSSTASTKERRGRFITLLLKLVLIFAGIASVTICSARLLIALR